MTREQNVTSRTRRWGVAAGAAGAVAVIGVGAYFVTGDHSGGDTAAPRDAALPPAVVAPSSAAPSASSSASSSAAPSASGTSSSPSPSAGPKASKAVAVFQEPSIKEAREKAAAEGHPLRRAISATGNTPAVEHTVKTADGSINVVTAKADLTGQRELAMAADNGTPVGDVRCTQRLRFANAMAPRTLPMVLLCWRVSAHKSVLTLATAKTGSPSPAASAAIIDREWAKL